MELLDRVVILCLIFWGPPTVFIVAAPICIPTSSAKGSLSPSSPALVLSLRFDNGRPDGCKWHLTVVLIFIPPILCDVEHLSMGLLAICTSLEKRLHESLAHYKPGCCFSVEL